MIAKLNYIAPGGVKGNNKFYNMKTLPLKELETYYPRDKRLSEKTKATVTKDNEGILCEWGRIGIETPNISIKPIKDWDKTLKAKIRKGYKDITNLFMVSDDERTIIEIADKEVNRIFKLLDQYSKNSIRTNYLISAEDVTQLQVEEGQILINELANLFTNNEEIEAKNKVLLKLFSVLPRKMDDVNKFLMTANNEKSILKNEQDLLDTLSQQVNSIPKDQSKTIDLLDQLNIDVEVVDPESTEYKKILDMTKGRYHYQFKIGTILKIRKRNLADTFTGVSGKNYELWHGSRNENYLPIIEKGLLIRPSNAVITGAMFGWGIYFADYMGKSLHYTSYRNSYYSRGQDDTAFITIFEVDIKNPFRVKRHKHEYSSFNEEKILAMNHDSLWAEKGQSLQNSEIIIYNPNKCTIKYLLELRST